MKKRSPRRKKPKLPPSVGGYVLAFYDCMDPDAPLEPLGKFHVPSTVAEARSFVTAYNAIACKRPRLVKLLGLFPLGMFR